MSLTLHWTPYADKSLVSRIGPTFTCTRAGATATTINASGNVEEIAANTARYVHDPTTLECLGLLIRQGRTNICLHNQDISNAAWVASNMTKETTSVTDPTGSANTNVRLTSTDANATLTQAITSAADDHVYSVYMKRVTGTGDIDITIDGGTTWTTQTLTSSWQQFTVTKNAANPTVGVRIVTSGDQIDFWGSDCNKGFTVKNNVILTAGTSVTAAFDTIQTTDMSWLDAAATAQGTFFISFILPVANGMGGTAMQLDDGSNNDRIWFSKNATDIVGFNSKHSTDTDGGCTVAGSRSTDTVINLAGTYSDDSLLAGADGALGTEDTTAAFPLASNPTTLRIGEPFSGNQGDIIVRELRYYNTSVESDEVLKQMSQGFFDSSGTRVSLGLKTGLG